MSNLHLTDRQWARLHHGLAGEVTMRLALRRQSLITDHLVMAERIARYLAPRFEQKLDIEDLVQDGRLGLVEAADRYRSEYGSFSKYAYFRVKGAIIDAHRRKAFHEETNESQPPVYFREFPDDSRGPDELAIHNERMEKVRSVRLKRQERWVFERALKGELPPAIAAHFHRGETWARGHLHAAKAKAAAAVS